MLFCTIFCLLGIFRLEIFPNAFCFYSILSFSNSPSTNLLNFRWIRDKMWHFNEIVHMIMPDYIHVPFIPYDMYYDPESAHYKRVNHAHSNYLPSPKNLIKIIINITLSNKMLYIASISLSCCCLLAIGKNFCY